MINQHLRARSKIQILCKVNKARGFFMFTLIQRTDSYVPRYYNLTTDANVLVDY